MRILPSGEGVGRRYSGDVLDGKVTRAWLLALAVGSGCGDADSSASARASATQAFDGERAFRDLVEQVHLGPRHPGSPGSAAVRELIRSRLRQAGWSVRDHAFEAELADGTRAALVNVIGELPLPGRPNVMLVTHYDTKRLPEVPEFAGANDGASGVAVLLELARALPRQPRALGYQLVFFDAEEAVGSRIDGRDGLYGSRALAAEMRRDGSLADVRALVLVDMVGDADLNLSWNAGAPPALLGPWLELARRAGVPLEGAIPFVDDHTPFVEAGVADVLALIDFHYGGRTSPGWRWHGPGDRLDGVSAESLNRVGRLLVEWLALVEPRLAQDAGANAGR
jgi:glutaminyl-peptide cyclotransferase